MNDQPFAEAEQALRTHALTLPETAEEFPWGERVIKVRGKIFIFLNHYEGALRVSLKLPHSRDFALDMPGTAPTGYGLGKAGWVTFRWRQGDDVDVERLRHWTLESYRAVAPKRLSALLTT
ncbi:MmcQ/YjbR family DNA-binding protein [Niveispirillum sp.]|uniref:MmcQ/YjbR family DNA-binding protein n=1 Tax=Niveispirillum sp. TaxID=1917217 RepID=UPI001B71FD9B|nr:MmcQ/YjbR family DNA-binding protein [Niveispirillum sp.]MBP7339307.1 MmcQ/YjbR family DNA-binding protein [Niveispirillum sp.]